MDPCVELGTAALRLQVAAQLFKKFLLGTDHHPGWPQTEEVYRRTELLGAGLQGRISRRTWAEWVTGAGNASKERKPGELDAVAKQVIRYKSPRRSEPLQLPDTFFHSMVRGGLLRAMLLPTNRQRADVLQLQRAASAYRPISAWHLHFDALEVCALDFGSNRCDWNAVKAIAALHVLRCIDALWGRRWGAIYPLLSMDGQLRAAQPSVSDRAEPQGKAGRRLFERDARVRWEETSVGSDAVPHHAAKTMLAILGDQKFLRRDRLVAWCFDLGSAAWATHALLWCDRYHTYWGPVSDTVLMSYGLRTLFSPDSMERDERNFEAMSVAAGVPWTLRTRRTLLLARLHFKKEICSIGLTLDQLVSIAERCEHSHPLRHVG